MSISDQDRTALLSGHADIAAVKRALAEIDALKSIIEDAVETMEAMDLHVDNPLYERLRSVIDPL